MRETVFSGRFKRDYKREKKTLPTLDDVLLPVLELLVSDLALPERLKDHALSGDYKGYRDCHIRPDLVLIYSKTPGLLNLARLGSHSEVFE